MKKQEKIFEVENLTQKIKDAKSVVLIDYRGLKANQTVTLRSQTKKAGDELQVAKNTLLARALVKAKLLPESKKGEDQVLKLEGPTLILFAKADEIASLKYLVTFSKANDLLTIKAGFLEGKILSKEELLKLAALPTKDQLKATLVGLLAQPPQRLVYGLNYNLQKLVILLSQVKNKKEN
jgi:large subunit ribosomal protein L10